MTTDKHFFKEDEYDLDMQIKRDKRAQKHVMQYIKRKNYLGLYYFLKGYFDK